MPISPSIAWFCLTPIVFFLLACHLAAYFKLSKSTSSFFQHFAAGVIFAAVSLELLPELSHQAHLIPFVIGFCAGALLMLAIKYMSQKIATDRVQNLPVNFIAGVATDLFIDGLLVGIAFIAGIKGGVLVTLALTIEVVFLALSFPSSVLQLKKSRFWLINSGLALMLLLGSIAGVLLSIKASTNLLQAVLSFGVAALLYLVTEELLEKAHEVDDSILATSAFFGGFLIIFVINKSLI